MGGGISFGHRTNWFHAHVRPMCRLVKRLSQGERSLPRVGVVGTVRPASCRPEPRRRIAQRSSDHALRAWAAFRRVRRAPRSAPPRADCSPCFRSRNAAERPITFGGLEIPLYRRKIPPLRPVPLPRFQSGLLRLSRHAVVPAAARGATRAAAFLEILYRRGRT